MSIPPEYETFWATAQAARPDLDRDRFLEPFAFGDSERLAKVLGELVLNGVKKATASLVWMYEYENKQQPRPGDLSIVTSWTKEPVCMIETTAVDIVPFDQVSEDFARTEGEDDGTLESWRRNHTEFFARECARMGRTPSPGMPVVCERFCVVFQPPSIRSAA